ncbi:hypothetical protein, partial [Halorubrum yunnanense]
ANAVAARLGRCEAVRCGVVRREGLKGAVARAKPDDASTADRERSERSRSAASHASPRDWGFGGVHRRSVVDHV